MSAYDTLETIVQAARARLLDAMQSTAGDVFTDTAPGTILAINAAWRKFQERLTKLGFQKFTAQTVISALGVVSSGDPAVQVRLDWNGYFDGANTDIFKKLPSDFIAPIAVDERISGGTRNFLEMDDLSESGLPLAQKQAWNKAWEWRGDAIYFPGATSATDIRLRYWSYAADFVPAATTPFANQTVPILRCQDALSNYICAEVAAARGDIDSKRFADDAETATLILVGRENPAVIAANTPPPNPFAGGQ